MITKYIKDNIINTECPIIAHGVNCQNAMGSGVAKAIYEKFPEVKTEYHKLCDFSNKRELLGYSQFVKSNNKVIYNCFTQFTYGYDGVRRVNYAALVDCFRSLKTDYKKRKLSGAIAIPKIGCGLAGGSWDIVKELIDDVVSDTLEVWVYEG